MTFQEAFNLAVDRHNAGNLAEAEQLCRAILKQLPNSAETLHLLGVICAESDRLKEGIDYIRRAIAIGPTGPEMWSNLGLICGSAGRISEAVEAFKQLTLLQPNNPAHFDRLGFFLQLSRRRRDAIDAYRKALSIRSASGPRLTPDKQELAAADNLLALLHFDPRMDAAAIYNDHAIWNRTYAEPLAASIQPHTNDRDPDRRLKIGYVSSYLANRPIGRFLSGLLTNHDHEKFRIFGYSDTPEPDEMTSKLRICCDMWRETRSLSDGQLAQQIRADGIDVLIDLGMHASYNRMLVFARKPAPVQVTYLAYCSTTGLKTIDYRLSDGALDPDDSQQHCYSEATLRLRSYWCYPTPAEAPEVRTSSDGNHPITFGSMNDFAKVGEQTLSLWASVLNAIPNSQMIVHAPNEGDPSYAANVLAAASVNPTRLQFVGVFPINEYFQQYNAIDLALDTTPWCGGTTTCDALWMGVPVVTLAGQTAVSRGGASILSQLGLTDLIARTPDQYVSLAVNRAKDRDRLGGLRRDLRQIMRASPLMDATGFARDFESILRNCWKTWCKS